MNQEMIQKLKAPFPFEEVEAKIQVTTQDKAKGMAVFYIDSRAIQNRLDEVIGPMNWKNSFTSWQNNAQLCGVAIYDVERKEWVGKYDGAECSEIEPVKGGLSDSFKRAACVWGIGRYLYQIDGVWVEVEQRGKGTYIKDSEQGKLKAAYDKAVAKIFGTVPQSAAPAQSAQAAAQPAQSAPPAKQSAPPAQSAQSSTPPVEEPVYQIQGVKPSGTASQVLDLLDNKGAKFTVYVKAGDAAIKPGARLRNMKMEKRKSEYGEFFVASEYQVAA